MVVNSFSKYYAMTGWRLGWLLVPPELRRAVDCLTGNFTICPPVLSQIAAVAAFTPEATAEADGNLGWVGLAQVRQARAQSHADPGKPHAQDADHPDMKRDHHGAHSQH